MTTTDTVNEDSQIVADDGTVYDLADNEKGGEVADMVGEKGKVMGTVEESEGEKLIDITSYELIQE